MVTILREADRRPMPEVAKKHGTSEQTVGAWRKRFGTLEPMHVRRLRHLAHDNTRLKKIAAERDLEIEVLREITRGIGEPLHAPVAGGVCARVRRVQPPRVCAAVGGSYGRLRMCYGSFKVRR